MNRTVIFGLTCVVVLAFALSGLAADTAKKQKSPKPAQRTVTGTVDKVMVKQRAIVVKPQATEQIQTQQTLSATPSAALTIRVGKMTKIICPEADKGKLDKGVPAVQEPATQEEKKADKPQQEEQDQKPAAEQPDPLSLLAAGQLVRVVYIEVTPKAKPQKPVLVQPVQAKKEDKPVQDKAVQDKAVKPAQVVKEKDKGAAPAAQADKKPPVERKIEQGKLTAPVLMAVSIQILKPAADKEQKK